MPLKSHMRQDPVSGGGGGDCGGDDDGGGGGGDLGGANGELKGICLRGGTRWKGGCTNLGRVNVEAQHGVTS
jgi:hypothetical protein